MLVAPHGAYCATLQWQVLVCLHREVISYSMDWPLGSVSPSINKNKNIVCGHIDMLGIAKKTAAGEVAYVGICCVEAQG